MKSPTGHFNFGNSSGAIFQHFGAKAQSITRLRLSPQAHDAFHFWHLNAENGNPQNC